MFRLVGGGGGLEDLHYMEPTILRHLKVLFQMHPHVDLKWQSAKRGQTALFAAVQRKLPRVVEFLLQQPGIDPELGERVLPNSPKRHSETPLGEACYQGDPALVEILLADPRVGTNTPTTFPHATPLWWIVRNGRYNALESLIAHRGMDLDLKAFGPYPEPMDVMEVARAADSLGDQDAVGRRNFRKWQVRIVSMLERFRDDRVLVVFAKRMHLLIPQALAAALFAVIVMLCDNYFFLRPRLRVPDKVRTARFLRMARRLPMELQVILALRAHRSPRDMLMSNDSKGMFRYLCSLLKE